MARWRWRVLVAGAAVACAVTWSPGRAVAAAEDGTIASVTSFWNSPFSPADVALLKEAASLNADQSAAAAELFSTAKSRMALARRKVFVEFENLRAQRREVEDDPEARSAIKPQFERYLAERAECERAFLADLRSLLNPEQAAAWDRFLTARRVRALRGEDLAGWPSIDEVVRASELKDAELAAARAALDEGRAEFEAAVAAIIGVQGPHARAQETQGLFNDPEPDQEAYTRSRRDAVRRYRDAVEKSIKSVAASLPTEAAERLLGAFREQKALRVASIQMPGSDRLVRDVLAVSTLRPDQKARVHELVRRAEKELARVYRDAADAAADEGSTEAQREHANEAMNEAHARAVPVWKELRTKVRQVLDAEQTRAFDAGFEPPLEPEAAGYADRSDPEDAVESSPR